MYYVNSIDINFEPDGHPCTDDDYRTLVSRMCIGRWIVPKPYDSLKEYIEWYIGWSINDIDYSFEEL